MIDDGQLVGVRWAKPASPQLVLDLLAGGVLVGLNLGEDRVHAVGEHACRQAAVQLRPELVVPFDGQPFGFFPVPSETLAMPCFGCRVLGEQPSCVAEMGKKETFENLLFVCRVMGAASLVGPAGGTCRPRPTLPRFLASAPRCPGRRLALGGRSRVGRPRPARRHVR